MELAGCILGLFAVRISSFVGSKLQQVRNTKGESTDVHEGGGAQSNAAGPFGALHLGFDRLVVEAAPYVADACWCFVRRM
jgi:hypothetical protein